MNRPSVTDWLNNIDNDQRATVARSVAAVPDSTVEPPSLHTLETLAADAVYEARAAMRNRSPMSDPRDGWAQLFKETETLRASINDGTGTTAIAREAAIEIAAAALRYAHDLCSTERKDP